MLFVLIGLFLAASIVVLCVRKSRESLFLSGMCLSLMLHMSGLLIFIAKKGGYSADIIRFLFFSQGLKKQVQYLYITLDQLGYLIALGRYLFPLFLLELALQYSMLPYLRRHPRIRLWAALLPLLSLVVYYPAVFRFLVDRLPNLQDVLVQVSYFWVVAYVAVSLLLMLQEFFAITMRFCKQQVSQILLFMVSLSALYLLYCSQDPSQVYRFYSYDYIWSKGIGYLQYAPSMAGYISIVVVNVICGILGFTSLLRYTQESLTSSREDMVMERKFDVARSGASVFVHSIKNQLLANRVLEKHMRQELDKESPDLHRLSDCVTQLTASNEQLLARCEDLYRTVKSQSIRLVPVTLQEIGQTTQERFLRKYPEGRIDLRLSGATVVLADRSYLSEALYNLLINAWEANLEAGNADKPVVLESHAQRLYTVLEVRDHGAGIDRSSQKKIFEPFYSSKNSNTSWGMGLYHVRTIVKAHLGSIRIESRVGCGSSFFILLPRYESSPRRPQA